MILQLLKKDCIIAKNYVAAVILIGVGLPVLLVWIQPQMLDVFALPGAVFFSSVPVIISQNQICISYQVAPPWQESATPSFFIP